MKALSYLNYAIHSPLGVNLMMVTPLYSQPFEPSKIPDLFEGWECEASANGWWLAGPDAPDEETTAMQADGDPFYSLFPEKVKQIYRANCPQTLNDFIRDCERTEIELNWNTENSEVRQVCGL